MKTNKISVRAFLERKDGGFVETLDILHQPDKWVDLTARDRRLIEYYAAKLINS
jgi:hypothetical protein